jgi:TetR/AcrR family transcriptional regulator
LTSDLSADEVRQTLLRIATREFAAHGFTGVHLETLAAQAGITRAMIYYYFEGREGLYAAVLKEAYRAIWQAEQAINTDDLPPDEALRKLVRFRVDYYIDHPDFVALLAIENQHEARYFKALRAAMTTSTESLARTAAVLAKGQASGLFRADLDVLDLYQLIVSLCFFNVSNRHTFGTIFKRKWSDAAKVYAFVADAVLRFALVRPDEAGQRPRGSKRSR